MLLPRGGGKVCTEQRKCGVQHIGKENGSSGVHLLIHGGFAKKYCVTLQNTILGVCSSPRLGNSIWQCTNGLKYTQPAELYVEITKVPQVTKPHNGILPLLEGENGGVRKWQPLDDKRTQIP
jgi:hypothetical protein